MKIRCLACIGLAAALAAPMYCKPALAEEVTPKSLSLEMTMDSSTTTVVGEAIVLHYRILNTTGEDASTYLGPDEKSWITKSLTDNSGQILPLRVEHRIMEPGGCHLLGPRIQAGGTASGYLIPTEWFAITQPGTYVLRLHANIPYGLGQKAESIAPEHYEHDLRTTIVKDFAFTIQVEPLDVHRFREAARDLKRRIIKEQDPLKRGVLIDALLSEPGSQAHWTWQELAEDPRITDYDRSEIAERLIESPSLETADTLATLVWQTGDSKQLSYYSPGNKELAGMYNSGDASLRQHIRDLYAEHGIQVADKIDIPQIYD